MISFFCHDHSDAFLKRSIAVPGKYVAHTHYSKQLSVGSTPNSCALHRKSKEMLDPVSSNTVVGVTCFAVLGVGVLEEIIRE